MVHSIRVRSSTAIPRRRSGASGRVGRRRHTNQARPAVRTFVSLAVARYFESMSRWVRCPSAPLDCVIRRAGAVQAGVSCSPGWWCRPASFELHAEVHRLCGPHLAPAPMANNLPAHALADGSVVLAEALRIAGRPSQLTVVRRLAPLGRYNWVRRAKKRWRRGFDRNFVANSQLAGSGGCAGRVRRGCPRSSRAAILTDRGCPVVVA